jgi:hypothetical protein
MFMSFALHLTRIKMNRNFANIIKIKTSRMRDVNYRPSAARVTGGCLRGCRVCSQQDDL